MRFFRMTLMHIYELLNQYEGVRRPHFLNKKAYRCMGQKGIT